MKMSAKRIIVLVVVLILAGVLGWSIYGRVLEGKHRGKAPKGVQPAPVKVAAVERGTIELKRTFSGTLEAGARFVLAPKVSGRVKRISVDIADRVQRGQVVAELDDDEYVQSLAQAGADQEVAKANLFKAEKALEISNRELSRVETLKKRGVSSESQYDEAKANQLASQAQFEVAKAQVNRARAALKAADIRLSYTKVSADWPDGDKTRVVAERFVDEGETVAANAPLISIVELSPITGVIYVTEKDYAHLKPGQEVSLTTDAFPGRRFKGRIDRIAPVFKETSRQARVELSIINPEQTLKPGMFIRATVALKTLNDVVVVPDLALTERGNQLGVFLVDEKGRTAVWRPVEEGIRQGKRVQVKGKDLKGRVVILGQQLLDDGSPLTIPNGKSAPAASRKEAPKP